MPSIFIVDDEQIIAKTLSLILKRHGYDATAFYDPRQLLEAARQKTPSIVISDVMMPQMNGVELAMHLRREHPTCQVLLFSGQAATSNLLKGLPAHEKPLKLLTKPLHPDALLREIRSLENQAGMEKDVE